VASMATGPLQRTDSLPSSGKQATRFLDTEGSAPSPQYLEVSHPGVTGDLGDVIVFTSPTLAQGFIPDLRQRQVAGTVTSDANTISGSHTTAPRFDIPLDSLPRSGFVLAARLAGPSGL